MGAAGSDETSPWGAVWQRLGGVTAPAQVTGFAQAFREFGRWVQSIAAAGASDDLHRRLADAAELAARQAADPAAVQPPWSAVPTALMAALPSGPLAGLAAETLSRVERWAEEFAALPLLGPYRGWSEIALTVQRTLVAERAAAARLGTHYRAVSADALADFARHLRRDDGAPLTSLRGLHACWIERAEAAYAARVMGADFARDFAAWVNACSAQRTALAAVTERVAIALDWPQRDEINVLLRRQRELEQAIERLTDRLATARAAGETTRVPTEPTEPTLIPVVAQPERTSVRSTNTTPARPRKPARATAQAPTTARSAPAGGRKPSRRSASAEEFDIARILREDG